MNTFGPIIKLAQDCAASPKNAEACIKLLTSEVLSLGINTFGPIINLAQDCAASPEQGCIKLLISKLLSLGIVLGASIVKIPQILVILKNGSAGISVLAVFLESVSILITACYNYRLFSFSTYGEQVFIVIQNLLILLLISPSPLILALFGLVASFLVATDIQTLQALQIVAIVIAVGSKLPQIVSNFSRKSTGQLSIITAFLQFAGVCGRVFTTLQEVDDQLVLASFLIAVLLNGILLAQILVFGNAKSKISKSKKNNDTVTVKKNKGTLSTPCPSDAKK